MRAFHNDEAIKLKYVNRMKEHIRLDNLVHGQGWESGKGCAVGCTLENYDHAQYPIELEVPEWLAKLEDIIFENMSLEKSKTWPLLFLEAINVGSDLEKIRLPFIAYLMEQNLKSLDNYNFDRANNPVVAAAIERSRAVVERVLYLAKNEGVDSAAWSAATSAAWSAADSAAVSAAVGAAWSAASAACASSAAWSATSAASAASSAWNTAFSAACAARAASAARAIDKYADKLIELIKECK